MATKTLDQAKKRLEVLKRGKATLQGQFVGRESDFIEYLIEWTCQLIDEQEKKILDNLEVKEPEAQ